MAPAPGGGPSAPLDAEARDPVHVETTPSAVQDEILELALEIGLRLAWLGSRRTARSIRFPGVAGCGSGSDPREVEFAAEERGRAFGLGFFTLASSR